MSRLPRPGGDDDIWGDLLNDFLKVEHNKDGTHPIGSMLAVPSEAGKMLVSSPSVATGVDWSAIPVTSVAGKTGVITLDKNDLGLGQVDNTADLDKPLSNATKTYVDSQAASSTTASNGLTKTGTAIQLGGTLGSSSTISLAGNTLGFTNSSSDKTEINSAGYVKVTRASGSNSFIEGWRSGELSPRFYVDAFGSMHFGGSGIATPPHVLAKDSNNSAYLNYSNTAGPASVLIIDSDAGSGSNAESTVTIRVKTSLGSEFIDRYANHYTSNGDVGFGALIQKTGTASYREYLFGYYDAADTDPANQIKNAERFYKIMPQAGAGSSTQRRRGQIYFRPPDGSTNPSAHLHIGQGIGGATTGSAPLKLDAGSLLTTPENGAIEYDGSHIYTTIGSTRYQLDQQAGGVTSVAGRTGAIVLAEADITNLTTDLAAKATDSAVVHNTGNETVAGTKTFSTAPIITPAAAPGSPANGQLWADSGQLSLTSEQGGLKLFHPATIFMATATVNNQNTTAETSLIGSGVGTTTLPANFLVPGKTIRLRLNGLLITSTAPPTSVFKIKLGATVICTSGTITLPASLSNRMFWVDATITCRTAGAGGAVLGEACLQFMTAASGTPTIYEMANTGTITVDTTASLAVDATHTWGTGASSSYTISNKLATVEVLG